METNNLRLINLEINGSFTRPYWLNTTASPVKQCVCVCVHIYDEVQRACFMLLWEKLVNCNCLDGEYRQLPGGTTVRSGYGIHLSADGTIYMGIWDNDKMNGSGRLQFSSGASYEGEFVNNCFNGKGQYTWPNGSHFDGNFDNNRFLCYFVKLSKILNYHFPQISEDILVLIQLC